jgi:hypothetical protein
MWEPQHLTALWVSTAVTGIPLPLPLLIAEFAVLMNSLYFILRYPNDMKFEALKACGIQK